MRSRPDLIFKQPSVSFSLSPFIAERWQGPDCILSLKRTGKDVSLAGRFERDPSPFAMVLSPGIAPTPKVKYRVEYTGKIWGRAIEGAVVRPREGELVRSLLDSSDGSTKVLMVVSDSGDEIRVIENPRGGTPQDYTLKRIVSPS